MKKKRKEIDETENCMRSLLFGEYPPMVTSVDFLKPRREAERERDKQKE